MQDWRNSEITAGDVGESLCKEAPAPVAQSALAPVRLTALYVAMVTPSIYITTPVKVILDQVLPSSIWPQKHFALGQVLNTESVRFENRSRHRRPSPRFFVVFVRCSRLMLGLYLTLSHDHFPLHPFQFIQ
jgi:hypothetical protein